ncbi:afadin-like isoform X1 [Stegodyphus dumicola]|uniref:afadin-like isoform X1 n=1 Tax=Stegodyphus dumicola TaxID=202533 RepID=UPI0015B21372|nr:afadin-like isoform X1 [Stegodyphus dumicola]
MANDHDRKVQEREKLKNIINQWNANRLDIFWLSEPNEDLEFHGAMRFYFQDAGQKVATKCIRVASTATTTDVIQTLIEKFRPDIRMLSIPEYALYEIHENGEERKLRADERPLLVQLDWHKDDREGRFLLRRMDEKSYISSMDACDTENFRRKLSKREKKEKKKREKKERLKAAEESKKDGIAQHLYSELPETSFTRSISNPEAVMRRRRQQQLEKKLQQFCQEGGTEAGGTLRIFGESLNKDVPYKTLLLSTKDTASYVVKEILDKYGYSKEDPVQYCLVQVIIPHHNQADGSDFQSTGGIREYILDDDDCPLMIQHQHNRNRGTLTFHVRRRPADYQPRKRKKKPKPTKGEIDHNYRPEDSSEKLPYLLELNPDGSETHGPPKKHRLYLNMTEVGSERSSSTGGQYLQLYGPNVQPRHCVIAHTDRIVTVTPSSRDAETYVNNMRIYETTLLQNGMVVCFGKFHTFRFVDPLHDQKLNMMPDPRQHPEFIERSRRDDQLSLHHHGSYETTFDADGNVETISTHSRDDRLSKKSDDALSHRSLGRESTRGQGSYERFEQKRGNDPILPAVLEFWEEGEDAFLAAAITQLDSSQVQFKLSPTYALYMAARYRASTHFRPETTPTDRAHRLTALMNNVAAVMHQVIQDSYRDSSALVFWLVNTSELLHFLKQDRHLSAYTLDAQDLLAESVQLAYRSLITCQQVELQNAMPATLEDRDDVNEEEGTTADVLAILANVMALLRRCRVNAAITIQMFSQLFHFINMWLFNKVVCETRPNLCTRVWGIRLKRRLARVEAWAEKQGLELAADCHLSRIVQAAHLLQAPKSTSEDLASISSLCFKLNSLQLRTLLERYQPAEDEPRIPREFIDSVVKVAENMADELTRSEGREVKLEEDSDLQLPFLLPEDGYSCDAVRGVPAGLQEFLQPLIQAGLCRLTIQPTSSGYWTIYMSDQDIGRVPSGARSPSVHSHAEDGGSNNWKQHEPEVVTIRLQKSNNGIGLSIVAAGGSDQDKLGIYVKSVVKGGAADLDGRLQAGDQLLKVDGHSLVGVNQEKAAELMTHTGPVVTLEVAKQGAVYNGLSDILSKPSPIIQRGPRRMSERDIPSRLMNENGQDSRLPAVPGHLMPPRMQGSKSVPSLNSNHEADHMRMQTNGSIHSHEMYNPAYSRTSSTASIPKATEYSDHNSRSKSAHNLRQDIPADPRLPYGNPVDDQNPPPYPGPPNNINSRPVAHPSMHQNQPPVHHSPHVQSIPASIVQEERHYQNISMYQQQPSQQPNPYTLHARSPSQPQPHPQQPPRSLHGSQSSLNRPDPQGLQSAADRSRPLSTLVSSREQEQYASSMGYVHSNSGPPMSPKALHHNSVDSHHTTQGYAPSRPLPDQRDFRSADHLRPVENEIRAYSDSMSHPELNSRAYPVHPSQDYNMMHMDPRQRDLLRQEAKMEEMREEVRRREDRERMLLQQQHHQMGRGTNWSLPRGPNPAIRSPNYQHGPQQSAHIHAPYSGPPPPPAPKPRAQLYNNAPMDRFPRPGYVNHENPAVYHDGSNSHVPQSGPRMPHQPPVNVSYRYGPSGYPPRTEDGTDQKINRQMVTDPRITSPHGKPSTMSQSSRVTFELPQQAGHEKKETSKLMSPSPWEREEKEKIANGISDTFYYTTHTLLHKQRLEEARRARDEEIRELESRSHLTPQQEDRLRTLRLEQEFQRRAEELHGEEEEDDDEDLLDRAENRERKLKMQEDLERARQRRLEWEMQQNQTQQKLQQQSNHNDDWKRQQQSLEEQEGRLRQLRLEEVQRKRELEAAKNVEERLLREARRRQDEFKVPNSVPHQIPNRPSQPPMNHQIMVNNQQHSAVNHQQSTVNFTTEKINRVEISNQDVPPPLPTSPPPCEPCYQTVSSQKSTSLRNQRLNQSYQNQQNSMLNHDKLQEPPAPPARKSSYEVTNQMSAMTGNRYVSSSMRNCDNGTPHYPKKVSFHESSVENVDCDSNGNHDVMGSGGSSYTLDDINEVLATPHNSQNLNTYNPGNTPGVIGTQEVYRDPRQRIEAERTQQVGTTKNPGPEKLTFKEKMKMFAQEVGEPETPKDKVKISRAQRDIETNLNGN